MIFTQSLHHGSVNMYVVTVLKSAFHFQTPRGNQRALTNTIVDKVEVFNSVEVRAPGIESQPNLVKQYRTDRGSAVDSVNFFR